MSRIIASTYEAVREIGSGGGGIVYLGRHLRLGKWIVLKADKRTLSAKPEALRREVDALKDLSHTYIPQVYDFVVEDGTVYTVMDHIEGESLDKVIKRGEEIPQAQIVEWACQLLEALVYLHSRPPHGILHSDIKPANIMRTPQGDIRLIDFNIALALGEEGAVKVGFSQGYASPEHYGLDYRAAAETQGTSDARTVLSSGAETVVSQGATVFSGNSPSAGSTGAERRTILLDVRSDIYSLGATLYHLLTGVRPASDAKAVPPITGGKMSPAVAAIIQKAMAPDPDQRYQTAAEMLCAFEHLHERDPRTKRRRRRMIGMTTVIVLTFLAGGCLTFTGLKQMERLQNAYVLAERSQNALRAGDVDQAVQLAAQGLTADRGIFDPPNAPQAQRALADALGVYDLSDGYKAARTLELPSEPLKLVMSPGGTRLAAVYAFQAAVFDLETGEELASLPLEPSALSDVIFLDEDRLIFAGEGAITAWDLDSGQSLWTGGVVTGLALSADGSRVAAVYKDKEEADIYDTATGTLVQTISFQGRSQRVAANDRFADPKDTLLAMDRTGQRLAVSFDDGTLAVFNTTSGEGAELLAPSAASHFEGGFFGSYFAFSTWDGYQSIFAVVDMDGWVQTEGFAARTPFHLQVDEEGILISSDDLLVRIDPATGEQTESAYQEKDIITFQNRDGYTITASAEGTVMIFDALAQLVERLDTEKSCDHLCISGQYAVIGSRDSPVLRLLRRESHPEVESFSYDSAYPHDEARLSADGNTAMLFSVDGFQLYDQTGTMLAEKVMPDPEQIYDQQYRREVDGTSYLEVIYNDGLRRAWSAKDGALLWEQQGEAPDSSLFEEFFTDRLRIESPLHGTPAAYDRKSGRLVSMLEEDAYLTYVTQVEEGVICEYISSQGERYGLLMDEACSVLARLPALCDIVDGTLVFDYPSGDLRQSRIYSTQELIALAEQYEEESV